MAFVILSGASLFEVRQTCDSADGALDVVLRLMADGRPNIRIVDEELSPISAFDLWKLAATNAVLSRRPDGAPRTRL